MQLGRTALLLGSALLTVSVATALAQTPAPGPLPVIASGPDAIEEDWELVISNPDPLGDGPQITTVMNPVGDGSAPFLAFDMNYREYPMFAPGGMQIQVWAGNQMIGTSSQGSALFNTSNETITWTQRMALGGGNVNYNVNNGQSTTWGQFGQGSQLGVSYPSSLASLIGYDPALSAANSGASWQSNRVTSLTLVQVRYYANGQLTLTDLAPRTIIVPPADPN